MSKRIERPGIKLVGMPGPVVAHALRSPLTQRLVITDAGCYPNAVGHHTIREQGIPETIVVICTKGVGWLRIGKEKHRISTHEVYVVSAGVSHEYWADVGAHHGYGRAGAGTGDRDCRGQTRGAHSFD